MDKLYPGISPTAASRMERIAGSYASMSNLEQLSFTQNLREARRKGAKAKAVTQRNGGGDGTQETHGDQVSTGSEDREGGEHTQSENADN